MDFEGATFQKLCAQRFVEAFRTASSAICREQVSDEEALATKGIGSPTEVLRVARLHYIGTLYHCAHVVPWGLFEADGLWRAMIEDDIRWMWRQLRMACALRDPDVNFGAWENILRHHRSCWKRLVLRAAEHACRQRRNLQLVHALHRRFIDVLKQENLITVEGNVQKDHVQTGESQTEIHACIACGRCFRTRGGLGAHNFKKHKIVSHVRRLFDQTSCGACLREYRTNGKLKTHLLGSNGCRGILLQRRHYVHPVPGAGSQA